MLTDDELDKELVFLGICLGVAVGVVLGIGVAVVAVVFGGD